MSAPISTGAEEPRSQEDNEHLLEGRIHHLDLPDYRDEIKIHCSVTEV